MFLLLSQEREFKTAEKRVEEKGPADGQLYRVERLGGGRSLRRDTFTRASFKHLIHISGFFFRCWKPEKGGESAVSGAMGFFISSMRGN